MIKILLNTQKNGVVFFKVVPSKNAPLFQRFLYKQRSSFLIKVHPCYFACICVIIHIHALFHFKRPAKSIFHFPPLNSGEAVVKFLWDRTDPAFADAAGAVRGHFAALQSVRIAVRGASLGVGHAEVRRVLRETAPGRNPRPRRLRPGEKPRRLARRTPKMVSRRSDYLTQIIHPLEKRKSWL